MNDRDGLIPYTLTSGGVPVQFANAGKPFGFIVFNGEALGIEGWEAKTGSQMFGSFASGYGANDDWLISPLLPGTAQTVKFYAKSITAAYGNESFEFFSSADLPIVSAFRKIDAVASVPEEWTEYTFTLPEGARYFAIRCTSNGTFAFCVDEITFTPESPYAGLTVVGYNIYRDGEKINDAPVAGAGYIDADAEPGNHIYTVTTANARLRLKVPQARTLRLPRSTANCCSTEFLRPRQLLMSPPEYSLLVLPERLSKLM